MVRYPSVLRALGIFVVGAGASLAGAQHAHQHAAPPAATDGGTPSRVTMAELHALGGVPRGWKFTLPSTGDVARGRETFAALECYKCHTIKGESFPAAAPDAKNAGPDLTGMGSHHPAEYFAESILNPNAVILDGPGYIGPDGKSVMPSFADAISVTQWIDLVAYLKSLTGGDEHDHHAETVHERVSGPYRVRLVYMAGGMHDHSHGGHEHHATKAAAAGGHLMAFITDRESNEALPYLPVTATVQIAGQAARTIKLTPMMGNRGFHYGADVTLPEQTRAVSLAIGPTTMAVMGPAAERYKKPVSAAFEWKTAK